MLLGELLPEGYIVTNISVLCLGKTKLNVCVRGSVPGVLVNMAAPIGGIFLTHCSVDMIMHR